MQIPPLRYQINTTSFKHYWEEGTGKQLLTKHQLNLTIDDSRKFIPLLFETDETTDTVNRYLFKDCSVKEGFQKIDSLLDNGPQPDDPDFIHDYFRQVYERPDWMNPELINQGAALCQRGGINSFMVLRNYALMGGYESAAINKPLIATGALQKGAVKRLAETVDFWLNITGTNALTDKNEGIRSVLKTRFIHSFSRLYILDNTEWEDAKWGKPLNNWDMLATNLGFSIVFITGLQKMHLDPSSEEIKGLFHLWKYVGYLLGIPLNLLPDNEQEAIEQLYYWTMTQSAADEDSISLATALYNESLQLKKPAVHLFKKILQQTHLACNYHMLGAYSCQSLQLPAPSLTFFYRQNLQINKRRMKKIFRSASAYQQQCKKGRKQQIKIVSDYFKYNLR